MFERVLARYQAPKIARTGLGAFCPGTLEAIIAGCCSRCHSPVSDFTLFGNALTALNGEVVLLCAACRGLPTPLPQAGVLRGYIDRNLIIVSMKRHRDAKNLRDIELLLALRTKYAELQLGGDHERAFSVKMGQSFKDLLYQGD